MIKLKKCIKVILMFVLLFAVVSAPLFYTEYQNKSMINEFVISAVHTDGTNSTKQKYNFWERIGTVNESVKIRTSLFNYFYDDASAFKAEEEIINSMEKQLKTLCKYNALPNLTFSQVKQLSVFKETYTNMPPSDELKISVWAIYAEYENYHVYAYMDTETSALYDITILSKNDSFIYQSDISENGFLEYLLTFSPIPNVKERDELFSATGSYTEKTIVLHLYSVNKSTEQFTVYRFGK